MRFLPMHRIGSSGKWQVVGGRTLSVPKFGVATFGSVQCVSSDGPSNSHICVAKSDGPVMMTIGGLLRVQNARVRSVPFLQKLASMR